MLAPCWARSRPAGRIRFLWDFAFGGTPLTRPFFGTAVTAGPRRKGVFKGDEAPKCTSVLLHASKDMLFAFWLLKAARFSSTLSGTNGYALSGRSVIVRAERQLAEKWYTYTVRDMQKPGRAIIEARARRQA